MQLPPVDRSPIWRPQGADLYSTGASGAVPVRPINPANPVESMDRLGEGAIVKAPDKPIVIELNINIKQEVVYRLAADAKNTIDQNSGIF